MPQPDYEFALQRSIKIAPCHYGYSQPGRVGEYPVRSPKKLAYFAVGRASSESCRVNYRVMSPPGTQENVGPADGGPLTTVLPTRRARLSERGTPFVKESFGNWFRHACREEGCPGSTHGLRKAGGTRAAENARQSISSWRSLAGRRKRWRCSTRVRLIANTSLN